MANGKKSEIGTDEYFPGIISRTVFDGIRMKSSNEGFGNRLREIAEKASESLAEMYEDLEKNKITVRFLRSEQVSGIKKLAVQLYEAASFAPVPVNISADDIKDKLEALAQPKKYPYREIRRAMFLAGGEPLLTRPYKNIDSMLIDPAPLYDFCDKNKLNKGNKGKTLGTQEYSLQMAKSVFCEAFMGSPDFQWDKSYKDMLEKQIEDIISRIKSDIKSRHNTDEYMEYNERERVLDIVKRLAQYCTGNPAVGFDREIEKLRRLEDYDNKVIEINRTGGKYPVDAELVWEGGKNILRLSANVYYAKKILFLDMAPVEPEPIKKPDILSQPSSFPEPGPPPDWTPEMEERRKAERLQAERRLKEEKEEAERQWLEALALEQARVDADFKKRKIAAEAEFKSWGRPELYEVFKGQKVYVTVDIKEVSSCLSDAIIIYFDSPTNTSMSWGGVTRNTFGIPDIVYAALHIIDWKPHTPKVIFLKDEQYYIGKDADKDKGTNKVKSYHGTARHEFGHSLGLGDAYDASYIRPYIDFSGFKKNDPRGLQIYEGPGADPNSPALLGLGIDPRNGLPELAMNWNTKVEDIEIEMVILAFYTGKRQNFAKQAYYQEPSDALK